MTTLPASWLSPPVDLTLGDRNVHLWGAALGRSGANYCALAQSLSEDERQRANRFRFEKDRERYVVARGLLRTILGRYLGLQAGEIQFCYGDRGKPALALSSDIRFNLAHSQALAVYAVTRGRDVGIDIEFMRNNLSWQQMAETCLTAREQATINELSDGHRQAFLTAWTRKEAYLKAIGVGLSVSPNRVDVTVKPGEPAELLDVRGEPTEARRWRLEALDLPPDYAGTLAVEAAGYPLRYRCFQTSSIVTG